MNIRQMNKKKSQKPYDIDVIALPVFGLVMDKIFYGNSQSHQHKKGQLLYAIEGLMHVYLPDRHFIVPPSMAVWIPSLVNHVITSSEIVKYRSVYFDCEMFQDLPNVTTVIYVTSLLQALILRVCEFTDNYQLGSPESQIGAVLSDEISRAVVSPFFMEIPKERRLKKYLCI